MSETTTPGTLRRIALPGGAGALALSGAAGDRYHRTVDLSDPSNAAFLWVVDNALAESATVLDVGANLGLTVALLARRSKGTIHAFEPSPVAFRHLCETVRANGADNVTPHRLALGSERGTVPFFENGQAAAASHVVSGDTLAQGASVEVEMTTVDAFVEEAGLAAVDFVKIDVEGFEPDVVAGARATIERFRPAVFLEVNAYTLIVFRDVSPRTLLERLMAIFPHVYRFAAGRPTRIAGQSDARSFLHDLLVRPGCVDDLYCAFRPLPEA